MTSQHPTADSPDDSNIGSHPVARDQTHEVSNGQLRAGQTTHVYKSVTRFRRHAPVLSMATRTESTSFGSVPLQI